jgi:FixJ family two-component response regulator
MLEKILLVDDETSILQGYQRVLGREFQIETALGATEALAKFATHSYAVIVSDMRMPGMDGVQLLAKVRLISPDTIRVMLTGNADMETAINAVNEGAIFRFLTKPCGKETLGKTLTAGLVQYRLITAERDLLEQTLRGSIQVLTEVLSLVNPAAFSRAVRIRKYVSHLAKALGLNNPWRFEVAAMMSQLGCVTLHPETVEAVYAGRPISAEEQVRFDTHPRIGGDLLANIPRMEPIAWMIANQGPPESQMGASDETSESVRQGADILRAALHFDEQFQRGVGTIAAITAVRTRYPQLEPTIFQALNAVSAELGESTIRSCPVAELSTGMVLNEEVRTQNGLLIVAKGQEVTFPLIVKLKNFLEKNAICGQISVAVPKLAAKAAVV